MIRHGSITNIATTTADYLFLTVAQALFLVYIQVHCFLPNLQAFVYKHAALSLLLAVSHYISSQ